MGQLTLLRAKIKRPISSGTAIAVDTWWPKPNCMALVDDVWNQAILMTLAESDSHSDSVTERLDY